MGNLGPYQDIVTAAKKAGGVPSLIKIIESKAVKKAAPKLFVAGAAAGAAILAGGQKLLDKRKADQALAEEAKKQLADEVEALDADGEDGEAPGTKP